MLEEDICIIQIGYLKAHFTVYQAETSPDEEFCEDLPDSNSTVFVLEFLRKKLHGISIDFRIIKDVGELGPYTQWKDIEKFGDIEKYTVLYQPPVSQNGPVYRAEYTFDEPGLYIGIVTAKHPTKELMYRAVFPFEVGGRSDFGYLPLLIFFALLVELYYLYSNGALQGWLRKLVRD